MENRMESMMEEMGDANPLSMMMNMANGGEDAGDWSFTSCLIPSLLRFAKALPLIRGRLSAQLLSLIHISCIWYALYDYPSQTIKEISTAIDRR